MGDHERGKEYVNLLHDCNWDDLVLRVISPEVERTKNAEEEVLEKAVFEIGHPLEVGRTDLKTNCFLSDLTVQEMLDEPGQLAAELCHVLGILTDHGDEELTLRWHEIFHGWLPIFLVVDNRLSKNLEKIVNLSLL